jgi:hypothetical protein
MILRNHVAVERAAPHLVPLASWLFAMVYRRASQGISVTMWELHPAMIGAR